MLSVRPSAVVLALLLVVSLSPSAVGQLVRVLKPGEFAVPAGQALRLEGCALRNRGDATRRPPGRLIITKMLILVNSPGW